MARRQRPLRVLIYTRICRQSVTEPATGRSVTAQAEQVRAYAASLGWQTVAIHEPDDPGRWQQPGRRQP